MATLETDPGGQPPPTPNLISQTTPTNTQLTIDAPGTFIYKVLAKILISLNGQLQVDPQGPTTAMMSNLFNTHPGKISIMSLNKKENFHLMETFPTGREKEFFKAEIDTRYRPTMNIIFLIRTSLTFHKLKSTLPFFEWLQREKAYLNRTELDSVIQSRPGILVGFHTTSTNFDNLEHKVKMAILQAFESDIDMDGTMPQNTMPAFKFRNHRLAHAMTDNDGNKRYIVTDVMEVWCNNKHCDDLTKMLKVADLSQIYPNMEFLPEEMRRLDKIKLGNALSAHLKLQQESFVTVVKNLTHADIIGKPIGCIGMKNLPQDVTNLKELFNAALTTDGTEPLFTQIERSNFKNADQWKFTHKVENKHQAYNFIGNTLKRFNDAYHQQSPSKAILVPVRTRPTAQKTTTVPLLLQPLTNTKRTYRPPSIVECVWNIPQPTLVSNTKKQKQNAWQNPLTINTQNTTASTTTHVSTMSSLTTKLNELQTDSNKKFNKLHKFQTQTNEKFLQLELNVSQFH